MDDRGRACYVLRATCCVLRVACCVAPHSLLAAPRVFILGGERGAPGAHGQRTTEAPVSSAACRPSSVVHRRFHPWWRASHAHGQLLSSKAVL